MADVFVIWAKLVDTDAAQGAAAGSSASAKPGAAKGARKSSQSGPPASSIRGFLVERGARGLSTPVIDGKLSLRTSVTGQVVLEDVRVPATNILPGASGLSVRYSQLYSVLIAFEFRLFLLSSQLWFMCNDLGSVQLFEQRSLRHRVGRTWRGVRVL